MNKHQCHNELVSQVAAFADDNIAPVAGSWFTGASEPTKIYKQASELGLLGLEVPKSNGGLGVSFSEKVKCCEVLAGADFGIAMSLVNTHNVAARLVKSAPENLQDTYLPKLLNGETSACTALTEPSAGTDVAAVQCRATQSGDSWVLSGEKTWIVNARHAGLSVVFAQCGSQTGADHIGAFLVDLTRDGVERYPIDTEFSQNSLGTGGFKLKNVRVNNECLLMRPGHAFKEILTEINGARIYVAAMCLGMLKTALQQTKKYGERRSTFGKPLSSHPSWQTALLDVAKIVFSLDQLIDRAIDQYEQGDDSQLLAAKSKIESVEACQKHLPLLLHAMGAEGLKPHHCFSRHLAAVQIAGLTDGATSMLKMRVDKLTAKQTEHMG